MKRLTVLVLLLSLKQVGTCKYGFFNVKLEEVKANINIDEDQEVEISDYDSNNSGKKTELFDIQTSNSKWNLKMINAEEVKYDNDKRVKVAIIDSGIDECDGITVDKRINLVDSEVDVNPCFDDITGHGTSVASVIKSTKTDSRDSFGINKNVELVSIKIMDSDNTTSIEKTVKAVRIAIRENVNIINMSFGTPINNKELHKAIKEAYEAGILMIASAGIGDKTEYPAAYKEVMAVGSVGADGKITNNTPSDDKVDIYAPGELIKAATNFGMETVCTGTSMAAPHVTAVASVLWQKNLNKSSNFIRGLLELSVKNVENKYTCGILDEGYALEHYNEYQKEYNKNNGSVKNINIDENKEKLIINNSQVKVEARWSKDNHEALVTNNKNGKLTNAEVKMIKAGIRYNDAVIPGSSDPSDTNKYSMRIWHSLTRNTNYMAAINMVGKIINNKDCDTNISVSEVDCFGKDHINAIKAGVKGISKSNLLKTKIYKEKDADYKKLTMNAKNKRLLLLGMELHIITDAFAHRSYIKAPYLDGRFPGNWIKAGTNYNGVMYTADDISICPIRYKAAGIVVKNVMNQCLVFDNKKNVQMKNTKLILSKQIVYNNPFDKVLNYPGECNMFLLYRLGSYAEANKACDSTFAVYENDLYGRSYEW